MNKILSQEEIDSIIDALMKLRDYSDVDTITEDMLRNQVVLTQGEIDKLIESLNTVKGLPIYKPAMNVVLSQAEIDALIDALNSYREYGQLDELNSEILKNQKVMTQDEIDALIEKLLNCKDK